MPQRKLRVSATVDTELEKEVRQYLRERLKKAAETEDGKVPNYSLIVEELLRKGLQKVSEERE